MYMDASHGLAVRTCMQESLIFQQLKLCSHRSVVLALTCLDSKCMDGLFKNFTAETSAIEKQMLV